MSNKYCTFFGEKPFYITNCLDSDLYALTTQGGTIVMNQPSPATIASSIHDLDRTDANAVIVLTHNVDHYWQVFSGHFTPITAAGGLVVNESKEFLFIFRRGKWDLPKGKLDEGEEVADCAIREVQEETGLLQVGIQQWLCNTWHAYHEKGAFILKQSVWYAMTASKTEILVPQTTEDITQIKWVPWQQLSDVMNDTYPNIKAVLDSYQSISAAS
jgi:8-oxo-dGTP pyrophosphatase MutT (NUDIX family)